MFMLNINASGIVVSKQIKAPVNVKSLRSFPLRSRELWMQKMHTETLGWKSRFYAFRYRGEWLLCDAMAKHEPVTSIKDSPEARGAAEMWLMARERKHRES